MELHVFNRFNRPEVPRTKISGESLTVPDQSMTITEIFQRSIHLLEDSPYHRDELPDDVPDFYGDYTELLQGSADDVSDLD